MTTSAARIDNDRPDTANAGTMAAGLAELEPELRAQISVLVIDDERTLRESCSSVLEHDGYRVSTCGRGEEAMDIVRRQQFDVVLVDLFMSQVSGMDILRACLEAHPNTIVVVMTGNPTVSSSIEALRAGAWDYLPKPFSATHLQVLLGRAAHAVLFSRRGKATREEIVREHGNSDKIAVLGRSSAFREAIDLARRVAATDASVFITGESGTGKELIAQFIHHHSRRSARPLVAVNCAALPETLLESEMFGHVKGAFTGAVRDKRGLLETANGGTMFLDELTEMSQPIQAKLLRVIQDGVVRRVGSEGTDAVVNVRFISATNRDPDEATEDGQLREDLYYRLRVVPIVVPPLRERQSDIPLLAEHFMNLYWQRHRDPGTPCPDLSNDALDALKAHPWKGNVRELQNVIEHTVVLLEPGSPVRAEDIPFITGTGTRSGRAAFVTGEITEERYHVARDSVIAEFEQKYLTWLVNRAGGNMSKAARIASVDRTTLYRLMEKHGLERDNLTGTA